mgnify:CR=1 FL=1
MKNLIAKIFIFLIILLIILSKPLNIPKNQFDLILLELGYVESDFENQIIMTTIKEHLIPKEFYQKISQIKSYNSELLPLYYEYYQAGYSVIEALNIVNYPNFLNLNRKTQKAILIKDILLVNRIYRLSSDDVPSNLTSIIGVPFIKRPKEVMQVKVNVLRAYQSLYQKLESLNLELIVYSAYRSYEKQLSLWQESSSFHDMYLAKPGHSEHQTGLALDLATLNTGLSMAFENTDVFLYLRYHAHEYGFILRYPEGKAHITGYAYEPWHFRFVGTKIAFIIFKENLTLEEYLYRYEVIV